ncbi:MAG: B12-binding domain-containing radical SAM protein [Magnetococcales bacterium]|nr:B12-binding domain-containing radical SAM protein [Magnetococcales bacterium]
MLKNSVKILLVSLRDSFLDSDRVMPPMGVMSLHSLMLDRGIESTIENDFDFDNIEKYNSYSHIGISCMTPQRDQAYKILADVKQKLSHIKVILGGPHAKYYLEDCSKLPFDHIVIGNGELALLEILTNGDSSSRILQIPISVEQMNQFPIPYRKPDFLQQYCFDIQGIPSTTILTAKGCPMKCTFCEDAKSKVFMYKPENIGRQIEQAKEAGFRGIMFFDDIFTLSKTRVQNLSQEIVKHDIYYRCFGHARSMTPEIAQMLVDSGCIETGFGAESGSQKILDFVEKRVSLKQQMDYVEICNKRGIKVKAFLMLGLPGEDKDSIQDTRKFLSFLMSHRFTSRLGREITNDFDLALFFPYKGTQIRDRIDRGKGDIDLYLALNTDQLSGFYKGTNGSSDSAVMTSSLTSQQLEASRQELLGEFKPMVVF